MAFDTEQPTILVVEDNGLLRAEIAETLRSAGCRVLEAPSGEAAVALIRAAGAGIQVLVTDIQLGGTLTGWDVADTAVSADQGMAVIYVSGIQKTRIAGCREAGSSQNHIEWQRLWRRAYKPSEVEANCGPRGQSFDSALVTNGPAGTSADCPFTSRHRSRIPREAIDRTTLTARPPRSWFLSVEAPQAYTNDVSPRDSTTFFNVRPGQKAKAHTLRRRIR
jgi:CheY-like chemotaxis protein